MEELSEKDIKYRCITPAIEKSCWAKNDIRMEYFFYQQENYFRGKKVKHGEAKKLIIYRKNNTACRCRGTSASNKLRTNFASIVCLLFQRHRIY